MTAIPELIAAWRAKKVTGSDLMRGLVSYNAWEVPISEKTVAAALAENTMPSLQLSTSKEGKSCLMLFSSPAAYEVYRVANSHASEQHFLKTVGTWLFRLPFDQVDQIWIDALSPYDIFYGKEHFPRFAKTAEAVLVETALLGLRQGNPPEAALQRVKRYANYFVAASVQDGKPTLVLAPDDKGRRLAPVFTADESFAAFAEEMNAGSKMVVTQVQMSGETLFDMLRGMALDGIVFNCSGPPPPVAFAQAFADLALKA